MQGPNAPWCVGSVFFPPQLLTSDVGINCFNQVGNRECLLSTGLRLEQPPAINKSKQTENFMLDSADPFIPRDLLQDHLQLDASGTHDNLLQGLKCNDESVLVFFVCGRGADRIGSTVCRREAGGKWYSVQTSLRPQDADDLQQAGWPVSPPLQHIIHQLSAVWAQFSENDGKGRAIVAARSNHHVYFSTVSRQDNQVHFNSIAVSKFQVPVAHVTWNPRISGESAVILENGVVCLFDIQASGNGDPGDMVDLMAKVMLESPMQRLSERSSHLNVVDQNQELETGLQKKVTDDPDKPQKLEKRWWRCEYGWLPQTLLVVNSREVFLVDLTDKQNHHNPASKSSGIANNDASSTNDIDIVGNVGPSMSSCFCSLRTGVENILAFCRPDNGGMYEFSIATERHLILFDIRQPLTPILQWEHGMRQEPPSLLMMCSLSALRSFDSDDKLKDIQSGRVILAASFKSGDMRAFCYGSDVEQSVGNSSKKQKVDGHTWEHATYAWDTSSRLYAPLGDVDDWRDVLGSSRGLFSETRGLFSETSGLVTEIFRGLFVPKPRKKQHNIAGIVLLSDNFLETAWNGRKKTFTILQLTGWGELLAQTYGSSRELQDPLNARISSSNDESDPDQPTGEHGDEKRRFQYVFLPAFLKCGSSLRQLMSRNSRIRGEDMRTGSILAPPSSRNSENAHKSILTNYAEGALNSGQAGTIGEGTSDIRTTQEFPALSPKLDKTLHLAGLETHLKAFMLDLGGPLSMSEVAQKVLCMGLPERLAPLSLQMPADLKTVQRRRYKVPSLSPSLGATVPSPKSGDHTGNDNSVDQTLLSNSLIRKSSIKGRIPLPLLLEVDNIEKCNTNPSSFSGVPSQMDPNRSVHDIHGEYVDSKHCLGRELLQHDHMPFEAGQKLLQKGSQYMEGLLEELVSKNEPHVISLNEPTQGWQGISNDDGESDSQFLLYHLLGGVNSDPHKEDPNKTKIATDNMNDRMDAMKAIPNVVVDDEKKTAGAFSEGIHQKFVAGKARTQNQEQQPSKQYLKIDPNLCPIKLSFTSPCEELEQGELTALEDLQADFLRWQQSFPPYKNSYGF